MTRDIGGRLNPFGKDFEESGAAIVVPESQVPLDTGFLYRPHHFAQDEIIFLLSVELGEIAVDEEVPGPRIHRQKRLDPGGEGLDRPKLGPNMNIGKKNNQFLIERNILIRRRFIGQTRAPRIGKQRRGAAGRAEGFEEISSEHGCLLKSIR